MVTTLTAATRPPPPTPPPTPPATGAAVRSTHIRCGGTLTLEEHPRTLRLDLSHNSVYWKPVPEILARCDRCHLVGVLM